MKKIISFNSRLNVVTGVQKVLLDVHHALENDFESKIAGVIPFEQLNSNLGIRRNEYVRCTNPFLFRDAIVIIHERKFLFLFWLLNHLLRLKIKIVYIHHSMLYGHKLLTLMPSTVVCISDKGRENLIEEFGVKPEKIKKIHNCVFDRKKEIHKLMDCNKIKILYLARINKGKRQLEIVEQFRGKLDNRVEILFAGDGPQYEELKKLVGDNDPNMNCLGFVADTDALMKECDFILLFSAHEGLPISLIEATMMGIPIICNDVGGNTEIAYNKRNAIVVNEWVELLVTLNRLPQMKKETYISMCRESREIYEKKFTFEVFKNKYLNLLNSL